MAKILPLAVACRVTSTLTLGLPDGDTPVEGVGEREEVGEAAVEGVGTAEGVAFPDTVLIKDTLAGRQRW